MKKYKLKALFMLALLFILLLGGILPMNAETAEIIIDNNDSSGVTFAGTWTTSTSASGYYGTNYAHDSNTGKSAKSIQYTPTITESDDYDVYLIWNQASNRASNVPIDISHSGSTDTIIVNQRANGGKWIWVGRFNFIAGTSGYVKIRTDDTDGYVIADAVRFVKAAPAPAPGPTYSPAGSLIFHSGFEASSTGVSNAACITNITGVDQSVSSPNDWVADLDDYSKFGSFRFQYEPGDCTERSASIVTDPTTANGNKVLKYSLGSVGAAATKGRVQAILQNNSSNLNEIYYKFRMYLHPDLEKLKQIPDPLTWFTIAEFWNQPSWTAGTQYPYRVSLDIRKPAGGGAGQQLYFHLKGERTPITNTDEGAFETVWTEGNVYYNIPTGQWLTCEIYYKEGNASTGRFYFALTPEGGSKKVIFDVTNWTFDPNNPSPSGLVGFHPFKLYTGKSTVNFVRDHGGSLQILWDDIEFWPSMQ
ncbi:hypothetical protein ACFQI7_11960 [Paenibacillus allorhizosphaerae]|uniref:Golvesin/Xly CBD-like domain-containing protein n=1 Tax=Paenibacillus allorhizosphaerae TaxID=2849866 RepID=A0ABM8VH72_9BACL|nr:hypothetical protein [Paenibacillus allorhizosphaerae]CAG7641031.1 hypothetical protein PAECIP111802_02695 [Paenibacillus allorhizosphaerae]